MAHEHKADVYGGCVYQSRIKVFTGNNREICKWQGRKYAASLLEEPPLSIPSSCTA